MNATYLLPIKATGPPPDELTAYLRLVASECQLVIVDGSTPELFALAHDQWAPFATHIPTDPDQQCLNGKVAGVLTGLRRAAHDIVVIADDDVRYDHATLTNVVSLLDEAACVAPQNYFCPLPWHARWDTARSLLNRAVGFDPPGTLAVRLSTLAASDGYDGDVLFENLELMRTVSAAGGRVVTALDCFVRRRPPSTAHFLRQRVRHAYDEFARPVRMGVWLCLFPVFLLTLRRRRFALTGLVFVGIPVVGAEAGRRRGAGRTVFRPSAALWAPVWVAERSVCAWLAVALRALGGVRYGHDRMLRSATRPSELRKRHRISVPS